MTVPQPAQPTMNLLEPHDGWWARRRARRRPAELRPCCLGAHTPSQWHYWMRPCLGCDCPADDHSLILVGHPCLNCATCPAYVEVARPNPSRVTY